MRSTSAGGSVAPAVAEERADSEDTDISKPVMEAAKFGNRSLAAGRGAGAKAQTGKRLMKQSFSHSKCFIIRGRFQNHLFVWHLLFIEPVGLFSGL
jgi:hypothetical protein